MEMGKNVRKEVKSSGKVIGFFAQPAYYWNTNNNAYWGYLWAKEMYG
jgi:hypothetical protein